MSIPQASTPTFSPVAGSYSGTQTVTISASTGGVICYNTTGSPATNGTTGCTTGTLYTGTVSVASTETLYAVAGGTGYTDSSVGSAAYTISAGCAAPPATYDWKASNSCSTGAACMNDSAAGNNAVNATAYPTYSATGGPNSTPSLSFNGSSNYLQFPTALVFGTGDNYSMLAVFNVTSGSGRYGFIGSATTANLFYGSYSGHQNLTNITTSNIGTGTATLTNGTWYATAATVTDTSYYNGNYAFFTLGSGTYATDGSGTTEYLPSATATNAIGLYYTTYANFKLSEVIYYNNIWTSGNLSTAAAYVSCKYGL
jgi:hypothetical protein